MAKKAVLPRVHAMVLCDEIEPGAEEGVIDLLGVRSAIQVESYPYVHPQLCVYLQVTGHEGRASGRITTVAPGNDERLLDTPEQEIEFRGPLAVIPIDFRIADCEFSTPGVYYVQAYFDEKLVCERLLILSEGEMLSNGRE
jgi:hypothetical protein